MYNTNEIINTVINGNSEIELQKIEDASIDCVVIDPPYNLLKNQVLDIPFDRELIFRELYRILKKNSFLVIFGSVGQLCRDVVLLEEIGFKCKEEVVWIKERITNFACPLPRRHESFYILVKGEKTIYKSNIDYLENCIAENRLDRVVDNYKKILAGMKNKEKLEVIKTYLEEGVILYDRVKKTGKETVVSKSMKDNDRVANSLKTIVEGSRESTCMFVNRKDLYNYQHGTQKPIELMSRILKLVSQEGDIVLDCFAGSGSTLLGAIQTNRKYIGIELNKEFHNIAVNRIKEKQGLFHNIE